MGINQVGVVGGGGCPGSFDVLVPDLPFDYFQPPMVHGVTQVGYGGPFVIRGNPVGAFIDTIRGFCSPMPMQVAAPDGSYASPDTTTPYTDLSGLGTYAGGAGGGYGGYPSVPCPPNMPLLNQQTGMCEAATGNTPASTPPAPPDTTTPQCARMDYHDSVYNDYVAAAQMGDACGMCKAKIESDACIGVINAAGSWSALSATIYGTLATNPSAAGKTCQDILKTCTPAGGGTGGTGTGGGGTTGQSIGRFVGGGFTTPFPSPGPVGPSNPTPSPGGMGIGTAPMPNTGGSGTIGTGQLFEFLRMPPLPLMPNPMGLTEGNVNMMPVPEPLGGGFDPSRSVPTRIMRTPMQALRSLFRR